MSPCTQNQGVIMSVDILDVVPDKLEYWPGETIKGKIILKVKNSFQSQGIFLNFKGGANVELVEQIKRSDRKRSMGGTERSRDRMYTNYYPPNSESLLSIGSYVAGDDSYPFSIQLPPQLASSYFRTNGPLPYNWSFIQGTGQVSYVLEVGMMLEGTAGHVSRKVIGIHSQLDLNNVPDASQAGEAEMSRAFGNFWSCCCGRSEPSTIMLKVKIEKRGYLPGETIPFEVEVKNQSGKLVEAATMAVQVRSHCVTTILPGAVGSNPEFVGEVANWKGELVVPREEKFIQIVAHVQVTGWIPLPQNAEVITNIIIGTCRGTTRVQVLTPKSLF
ncbi:Arrestin domain-containing protein 2 [Orchesella cincta]|uniref:Arrestin domain-containing protein 2 n=1 Tax=Orchesella cincta TaxID=48709 RepID=A0A1D2MF26_ORCCI|nr:Arrestin domain-containing protein 2 [Orchesella cincta]